MMLNLLVYFYGLSVIGVGCVYHGLLWVSYYFGP
ncbi:hypothetical protein Sbal183_3308 [Shewanella baltica OS183]|nr:hypothetical protein Sbal175_1001 [Shewanella baltica BA175]EHQ16190.1 hypothetical protein Sbal183_3308 [Shewanella baltica OS183]